MRDFAFFYGALPVALIAILIAANSGDREKAQNAATETSVSSPTAPETSSDEQEQAANARAENSKQPLKINIAALEESLKTLRRDQPGSWLEAFEERVNEIYEGDELILLEAKNNNNRLQITGYIKKGSDAGRSKNDEVVFVIEQNGDVSESSAPGRITTYTSGGYPVYHHWSFADTILQYWVLHQIFASPSYRYDTPASRLNQLRSSRTDYRNTQTYTTQRQNNSNFSSRWNSQVSVPRTSVPSVAPAAPSARTTPTYTAPPAAAPAPQRTAPSYSAPAPSYRSTPSYSAPSSSGGRR